MPDEEMNSPGLGRRRRSRAGSRAYTYTRVRVPYVSSSASFQRNLRDERRGLGTRVTYTRAAITRISFDGCDLSVGRRLSRHANLLMSAHARARAFVTGIAILWERRVIIRRAGADTSSSSSTTKISRIARKEERR